MTSRLISFPLSAVSLCRPWTLKLNVMSQLAFGTNVGVTVKPMLNEYDYESAILKLNSLQSNAVTIKMIRKERLANQGRNLVEMVQFMNHCGLKAEDIDALNVIHVSGTKGKGSTCAFTESILRRLGYKTGFYSSPHLVHARERIRIDGRPLSKACFAKHFHVIYNRLLKAVKNNGAMPAYFKFLTLMAFHVFIEEKVDVAVVEVGIGGEYDCTNVIRHPIVCGVTTLDYDHTALLGKTLSEIAWQKAGIFKSGSEAIVVDQTEEALSVMVERARERKCILHVAPRFDEYDWPSDSMDFGIKGRHQYPNISLAMQLVKVWMERTARKENLVLQNQIDNNHQNLVLPPFPIPNEFLDGLRLCEWPGRSQVIQNRGIVFYLDGAHTQKSVEYCSQWFDTERRELEKKLGGSFLRVLLFHCTADRTPDSLLPYFKSAGFDIAVFCPARLNSIVDPSSDQANFNSNENSEVEKVNASECVWRKVNGKSSTVKRFSCITEAFNYITSLSKQETRKIEVLVTGSLHLIGGVLSLITPD